MTARWYGEWLMRLRKAGVPGGFTIAFDVDSVLFPINDVAILPALNAAGYNVTKEDITDFQYEKCFDLEAKRIAFEQFKRADLYDGYTPNEGAMATLDLLRSYGNRVLAVSSPFAQHASSKWAYCERAGFDHADIILCGDKVLVDFDVLVDDRPQTIHELGQGRAVVFDQPWNRFVRGYERARSWEEVIPALGRVLRRQQEGRDERPTGPAVPAGYPASGTCVHGRSLQRACGACGMA